MNARTFFRITVVVIVASFTTICLRQIPPTHQVHHPGQWYIALGLAIEVILLLLLRLCKNLGISDLSFGLFKWLIIPAALIIVIYIMDVNEPPTTSVRNTIPFLCMVSAAFSIPLSYYAYKLLLTSKPVSK